MSPQEVMLAIVEQIKAVTDSSSSTAAATNTDPILKTMGAPYEYVLRFIWAAFHHDTIIQPPKAGQIQDKDASVWAKETLEIVNPALKKKETVDLTSPGNPSLVNHDGAVTAMTKLSECMVKHQEAVLWNQEEKGDTRLKAWNKLPSIQKNIILLGGVDDQGVVPDTPTEEMLSILGCQNGAQVDQYLKQVLIGHNIKLEPCFCSAINKGIFV